MSKYFSVREMQDFVDSLSTGYTPVREGTMSINHDACGDSRKRLYITSTHNEKYLFFCHNCSMRGCLIVSDVGSIRKLQLEHDVSCPLGTIEYTLRYWANSLPCASLLVTSHLSQYLHLDSKFVHQQVFRLSGGKCFVEPCGWHDVPHNMMQIGTGPSHGFIEELPAHIAEYSFSGVQRWTWADDGAITKRSNGKMVPALFYDIEQGVGEKLLVICEDPISAMHVVQCGADALCLFGTNIKHDTLCDYVIRYDSVMIWLDGDSPENIEAAASYKRVCHLVVDHVVDFYSHRDVTQLRYSKNSKCGWLKHDPKNYRPEYLVTLFHILTRKGKSA